MQLKLHIDAANGLKANVSTVEAVQVQVVLPAALPVRWWLLGKELSSPRYLLYPQQAVFISGSCIHRNKLCYLWRQQSQMIAAGTFESAVGITVSC